MATAEEERKEGIALHQPCWSHPENQVPAPTGLWPLASDPDSTPSEIAVYSLPLGPGKSCLSLRDHFLWASCLAFLSMSVQKTDLLAHYNLSEAITWPFILGLSDTGYGLLPFLLFVGGGNFTGNISKNLTCYYDRKAPQTAGFSWPEE